MTELTRHIETLLKQHNCVIVPRLGGFVAQYVPATYDAEAQSFRPPYRSIGFNPQLTINDGLLVQSYMRVHSTTYSQTLKMVERAVAEMTRALHREGSVTMDGVGRLGLGIDGRYEFEPMQGGVAAPEFYGLRTLEIASTSPKMQKTKQKTKDDVYHIRINRELANYVAAALVGVIFYLAWALPTHRDQQELSMKASIIPAATIAAPQEVKAEAKEEKAPVAAEPVAEETPAPVVAAVPEGSYSLVLAAGVTQAGAEHLVKQLAQEGFEQADILPFRNSRKVVYGTFSTEAEARAFLRPLLGNAHFRDAWITRR